MYMHKKSIGTRLMAWLLSMAIVVVTVPPVGAVDTVYGTVKSAGSAWVAADSADWSQISSTRPLLSGDRLRTDDNGYVLADLGEQGVVGLYGNAQVAASRQGDAALIDVAEGKVAFHIADASALQLGVEGARVASDSAADGYIEVASGGQATVTAEQGSLRVSLAGTEHRLAPGQRLVLGTGEIEAVQLAGAYGEPEQSDETPMAPPPPPPPPAEPEVAVAPPPPPPPPPAPSMSASAIIGWTALAVVTAAVIYEIADDDNNDKQASPY